jgi:hypothetical protein
MSRLLFFMKPVVHLQNHQQSEINLDLWKKNLLLPFIFHFDVKKYNEFIYDKNIYIWVVRSMQEIIYYVCIYFS